MGTVPRHEDPSPHVESSPNLRLTLQHKSSSVLLRKRRDFHGAYIIFKCLYTGPPLDRRSFLFNGFMWEDTL